MQGGDEATPDQIIGNFFVVLSLFPKHTNYERSKESIRQLSNLFFAPTIPRRESNHAKFVFTILKLFHSFVFAEAAWQRRNPGEGGPAAGEALQPVHLVAAVVLAAADATQPAGPVPAAPAVHHAAATTDLRPAAGESTGQEETSR